MWTTLKGLDSAPPHIITLLHTSSYRKISYNMMKSNYMRWCAIYNTPCFTGMVYDYIVNYNTNYFEKVMLPNYQNSQISNNIFGHPEDIF